VDGCEQGGGMSHSSGMIVARGLLPLLVRRYPLSHSSRVGGAAVGVDMTAGVALGAAATRGSRGCS